MGAYKYIKGLYKERSKEFINFQRQRLISWRKENSIIRISRPTNLARARQLGYKAKKGFILCRVRLSRGGKKTPKVMGGRSSKHRGRRFAMAKSYQRIAEERAAKKFQNMEVLNSYKLAKDGKHYWFEILLIDPCLPEIKNDKNINWICSQKGRAYRGLTSAAKKGRGLRG